MVSKKGKPMLTTGNNEWYTPQYLFDALNKEFDFTLDPCATELSAKCKNTIQKKIMDQSKIGGCNVFINPPYSAKLQDEFVEKAYKESLKENTKVVLLIPARVETDRWHKWIFPYASEIRFLKGRVRFYQDIDGVLTKGGTPPMGNVVVVFDNTKKSQKVTTWDWQKDI